MYNCEKCNREFKNPGSMTVHKKYCDGNGSKLDKIKEKRNEVCPKCGQRILTSKEKHYKSCNGFGPRRKQPHKGYNSWLKGVTIEEGFIKKYGKKEGKIKAQEYKNNISRSMIGKNKGKILSKEQKEKRKKRINFGIVKRSQNEIYFGNLCKKHFKKVLFNEEIFNGWDADVIIEDIRTAVLWNGKWHYEKIMKKHSVEQVQNRDRLKIIEIEKCGYKSYIIKDMGRYNKEFVEKEFKNFITYAVVSELANRDGLISHDFN
jgi:DNA-directed RNA polymerase subunit RPC12/RpoP